MTLRHSPTSDDGNAQVGNGGAPVLSEYLTDIEFARELGLSVRTLARWRRLHEGPAVTRIGRKVLYRRGGVRDWLGTRESDVAV